jgi:hypothetical protein
MSHEPSGKPTEACTGGGEDGLGRRRVNTMRFTRCVAFAWWLALCALVSLPVGVWAQPGWNVELVGFTGGAVTDVQVEGHYAYCTVPMGLIVVDVSDPTHPHRVGSVPLLGYAKGVFVSGGYAYVADGYAGLRVIDVSDPAHPHEVGFYDTPSYAKGVFVSGGYAYVADGYAGLRVIDVSDPAHPYEVGFYDTTEYPVGVFVSGGYAYVTDGYAGLRVIDVSDPAHPYEVGFYNTPGYAKGVFVSGGYAYVADERAGLRVVDVSDPTHPYEVGFYDTPGYAIGVFVSGGYAYVADGWSGLRVIDVSDPAHPHEVGFYDTPGDAYGVFVSGGYAYVADGWAGLLILRFTGARTYSVSGRVELQDFGGDVTVIPVTVELRRNGNVVRTEVVPLDAQGGYTLHNVVPDTYDIAFKASHWLRVVVPGVTIVNADVTGVDVYLTNGDIDGDNEVTLFDFGALVAAFGSTPYDSNWNPNADLDGDLEVTLFDFGILVRNFGAIGDE